MQTHARSLLSVLTLAALWAVAACDGSPNDEAARSGPPAGAMPGIPGTPQASQAPEHMAQGTVNSVDEAAGTVNISHGPVASANWPAMTMSFKLAEGAPASSLQAGQRVGFRFTIQGGMNATVTEIAPLE